MTEARQQSTVLSVMLIVPDAEAAVAWYKDALGATELWNLGGVAGLEVDGAPFLLHEVNASNPAIRAVVGRFRVLAGLTRLLISSEEEYPIIGSGRDAEENQHINGKRREYKNIVMAEKRHDSPGRR